MQISEIKHCNSVCDFQNCPLIQLIRFVEEYKNWQLMLAIAQTMNIESRENTKGLALFCLNASGQEKAGYLFVENEMVT